MISSFVLQVWHGSLDNFGILKIWLQKMQMNTSQICISQLEIHLKQIKGIIPFCQNLFPRFLFLFLSCCEVISELLRSHIKARQPSTRTLLINQGQKLYKTHRHPTSAGDRSTLQSFWIPMSFLTILVIFQKEYRAGQSMEVSLLFVI